VGTQEIARKWVSGILQLSVGMGAQTGFFECILVVFFLLVNTGNMDNNARTSNTLIRNTARDEKSQNTISQSPPDRSKCGNLWASYNFFLFVLLFRLPFFRNNPSWEKLRKLKAAKPPSWGPPTILLALNWPSLPLVLLCTSSAWTRTPSLHFMIKLL
jgi:hypothetical protein